MIQEGVAGQVVQVIGQVVIIHQVTVTEAQDMVTLKHMKLGNKKYFFTKFFFINILKIV